MASLGLLGWGAKSVLDATFTPPANPAMLYSEGSSVNASTRSVAVDNTTDPAHPVVWVIGTDL